MDDISGVAMELNRICACQPDHVSLKPDMYTLSIWLGSQSYTRIEELKIHIDDFNSHLHTSVQPNEVILNAWLTKQEVHTIQQLRDHVNLFNKIFGVNVVPDRVTFGTWINTAQVQR